jgi:hypothetical protein
MGLLTGNEQSYYNGSDGIFNSGDENYGDYQFISLKDIINNFTATYIGEDKLLSKVSTADVYFHAHRALAELTFDTFKSCKTQEIKLPPYLTMPLPRDYVNYVKLTWSDSAGIEHIIYPTSKTSNPKPIFQNDDEDYNLTVEGTLVSTSSSVTLDAEYKNILVGMRVSSPSIPVGTFVEATSNASSITTITLGDGTGTGITVLPTISTTETLTFTKRDNSLILQEQSSHIIETLSWDATDPKITAASADDISDIKVGMLVSNEYFAEGTIVISINGAVITTSTIATTAVASGGEVTFLSDTIISDTWSNYKSATPSENQDAYQDNTYWPAGGERYGIDPQHAQTNGSFFIDCNEGKIHFSSNLNGKNIILKYISDSLGTDAEYMVHKMAEEAVYKWIAYGCLIARVGIPEYVIQRFKKEKFAETRKAKLRLSNIKLEEITQILRGKSKQIKH